MFFFFFAQNSTNSSFFSYIYIYIYIFFFPSWNALFFFLHNYRNGKGKVYESFLCLLLQSLVVQR